MTEIGIIGFGQFGQFMARHLASFFDITVYDCGDLKFKAEEIGVRWSDFENTANKKIIIFAVPLSAFEEVLKQFCAFSAIRRDVFRRLFGENKTSRNDEQNLAGKG